MSLVFRAKLKLKADKKRKRARKDGKITFAIIKTCKLMIVKIALHDDFLSALTRFFQISSAYFVIVSNVVSINYTGVPPINQNRSNLDLKDRGILRW